MKQLVKPRFITSSIFVIATFFLASAYGQTKPWIAPGYAASVKNPVAANPESLKVAKTLYITNCSPCHGTNGKGDGPAAAGLAIKPADHTSPVLRKETDGALYWKISVGHTPMPSYKTILTDQQRWELVNYIRSLSKVR